MSERTNHPVPYSPSARKQSDQKFCYGCSAIMHMSATVCPACGATQTAGADHAQLGATLEYNRNLTHNRISNSAYCRGCGHSIHHAAPFCPHCGAPQRELVSARPEKSKVAAALLAFILGGFGAHKFYLGEVGMGVLYLLFSWTLIPAFVALIEGIYYLAISSETFARRYG